MADGDGQPARQQQLSRERLALLRCVACDAGGPLDEVEGAPAGESPRVEGGLAATSLACASCGHRYPVTADGIPLMWTEELRRCLNDDAPPAASPMSANVSVYNHVSDDYALYWRQHGRNARRMQAAARAALGELDPRSPATTGVAGATAARTGHARRHLDVGCGPGHVLHWLAELGAEQYALDVSLSNLRNVRKGTRAFVVLGSADRLPFADGAFDLVTESSVLHHVERWDDAVAELARVCRPGGGVAIDSEPTRDSKRWSRLATAVFEMRWYPYVLLSYFSARKFWFRDARTARLTFERAEIHNRPNTGLPLERMVAILENGGMLVRAVCSPDEHLEPRAWLSWQEMLLHALSGHNPLRPRWGWVTVTGHRPAGAPVGRSASAPGIETMAAPGAPATATSGGEAR